MLLLLSFQAASIDPNFRLVRETVTVQRDALRPWRRPTAWTEYEIELPFRGAPWQYGQVPEPPMRETRTVHQRLSPPWTRTVVGERTAQPDLRAAPNLSQRPARDGAWRPDDLERPRAAQIARLAHGVWAEFYIGARRHLDRVEHWNQWGEVYRPQMRREYEAMLDVAERVMRQRLLAYAAAVGHAQPASAALPECMRAALTRARRGLRAELPMAGVRTGYWRPYHLPRGMYEVVNKVVLEAYEGTHRPRRLASEPAAAA